MISKFWTFLKCVIDYAKYRSCVRSYRKIEKATKDLERPMLFGGQVGSYSLGWRLTFSEFRKKWLQKYTVVNMERLRELAVIACESPDYPDFAENTMMPDYEESDGEKALRELRDSKLDRIG